MATSDALSFGSQLSSEEYGHFHVLRKNSSDMDELQLKEMNMLLARNEELWKDKKIRVLSIGSGLGDFDIEIIRTLKRLGIRIKQYLCIEPLEEHIEPLKKNLTKVLPAENYKVVQSLFEHAQFSKKFHLIHNIHVIHWMPQPVEMLFKIEKLLKPIGTSVTVLQTRKGWPRLYKELGKESKNGTLTAEDLCEELKAKERSYSLHYINAKIDVTAIIQGKPSGKNVLQFILSRKITDQEFDEAIKKIKECSRKTLEGKYYFDEPFAFVINRS